MTKKHFKALAENLRMVKPFWDNLALTPTMIAKRDQWIDCIRVVGDVCKASNPGFKRERFNTACGMD